MLRYTANKLIYSKILKDPNFLTEHYEEQTSKTLSSHDHQKESRGYKPVIINTQRDGKALKIIIPLSIVTALVLLGLVGLSVT